MNIEELQELLRAKIDDETKFAEAVKVTGVSPRFLLRAIEDKDLLRALDTDELLSLLDYIGYEIVPKWRD